MSISIDKLNKDIDFTGVIASPVDERDYTVAMASVGVSEEIPDCWETWQPPVENQGNTGNCVAQTFANIMECIDHREGLSHRDRSVGSIYGRSLASTPGMIPRQGCEAIVKHGVLYRDVWEYLGENPECRNRLLKVPSEIMTTAKKAKMYIRINTFEEMQRFMMKYNLPVYGSGKVSEFIDERLGEGRHAVTLFGWSSEDFVKKNKKRVTAWRSESRLPQLQLQWVPGFCFHCPALWLGLQRLSERLRPLCDSAPCLYDTPSP